MPANATLTERENYLLAINGDQPKWVPYYRDAVEWTIPCFMMAFMGTDEKRDFYGVPWTANDNGPMPDVTQAPVLEDIANWRDVVNFPDLDAINWEGVVAFDMANHDPNKAIECFTCQGAAGNFFLPIVDMMGFEEGLCAFIEDPDSVREFCEHACDFYMKLVDYEEKYYNPDVYLIADDFCTANGPMISENVYSELLRPYYKKLIEHIRALGKPVEFHMCGKGEQFIEDLIVLGVSIWQPAQPLNDLSALKAKYGNRIVFTGGWLSCGEGGVPGAPEDVVRKSARDAIDALAPGGGYVFWDGDPVGTSPDMLQKISWLADEARTYGKSFYA